MCIIVKHKLNLAKNNKGVGTEDEDKLFNLKPSYSKFNKVFYSIRFSLKIKVL